MTYGTYAQTWSSRVGRIHNISRTEADVDPPLPRFNTPLELGVFVGVMKYGGPKNRTKRFISDIAGQDIPAHDGDVPRSITELAKWLRTQSRDPNVPGGAAISNELVGL